jgi:hypothetical protein
LDEINRLVLESMLIVNETVLGLAPAESQGMTLDSSAYAISLLMVNAVSSHDAVTQTVNASIVSTCAEILRAARTSG